MPAPALSSAPVLFAYDGSELARLAIEHAGALMTGRRAVVLHVHEPITVVLAPVGGALPVDASELAYEDERATQRAADRAEAVADEGARLARAAGFDATAQSTIARGTAGIAGAIVDKATAIGASVIVVGSHGRSAIGAALLGSVSTAVLHRARVPVLVVPRMCGG